MFHENDLLSFEIDYVGNSKDDIIKISFKRSTLNELIRELRICVGVISNCLVRSNKLDCTDIDKRIELYPEEYPIEFLKEHCGDDKEWFEHMLKVRESNQRLKR